MGSATLEGFPFKLSLMEFQLCSVCTVRHLSPMVLEIKKWSPSVSRSFAGKFMRPLLSMVCSNSPYISLPPFRRTVPRDRCVFAETTPPPPSSGGSSVDIYLPLNYDAEKWFYLFYEFPVDFFTTFVKISPLFPTLKVYNGFYFFASAEQRVLTEISLEVLFMFLCSFHNNSNIEMANRTKNHAKSPYIVPANYNPPIFCKARFFQQNVIIQQNSPMSKAWANIVSVQPRVKKLPQTLCIVSISARASA